MLHNRKPDYGRLEFIEPEFIGRLEFIEPEFIGRLEFIEPEFIEPEFIEPEFIEPEFIEPEFIEPEFIIFEFIRLPLLALLLAVSPQAIPNALIANTAERAKVFFIIFLILLSSSKIKFITVRPYFKQSYPENFFSRNNENINFSNTIVNSESGKITVFE